MVFRLCALLCRSSLAATVANVSGRYSMTIICSMAAGERFHDEGGGRAEALLHLVHSVVEVLHELLLNYRPPRGIWHIYAIPRV